MQTITVELSALQLAACVLVVARSSTVDLREAIEYQKGLKNPMECLSDVEDSISSSDELLGAYINLVDAYEKKGKHLMPSKIQEKLDKIEALEKELAELRNSL